MEDSFFYAFYFAFDCSSSTFPVMNVEKYVGDFCVELEVYACILQELFLHGKDQGLVLIVFSEFQGTEIRKSTDMVDETLGIVRVSFPGRCAQFSKANMVLQYNPKCGIKHFIIEHVFESSCHTNLHLW